MDDGGRLGVDVLGERGDGGGAGDDGMGEGGNGGGADFSE